MNASEVNQIRRSLAATAWIAAIFCAVLGGMLLYGHFTAAANDPWKSPQLLALKQQLAAEPKNERLQAQIRKFDLEFRQRFQRRLTLDRWGGWFLLGGTLLLAVTARKAVELGRAPTLPQASPLRATRQPAMQSRARWAVAATAGATVLALITLSLAQSAASPESGAGIATAKTEPVSPPWPSDAEMQSNSPRFRGWDGSGATSQTNYLLAWDEKTGRGIGWKSPVLAPGHNSPVVWRDQVIITGGTASKREAFAYGFRDGALLWRRGIDNVPGGSSKPVDISDMTGMAASTAATDGLRLYVIFANGDCAALSFSGDIVWSKALGPLKNSYGHATSLATWHGLLIVQLDQGESGGTDSKLLALDGATGRQVWSQNRPVPASWATPIVAEAAGRAQIITLGEPWVIAYATSNGNELWRARLLDNEIVPSPIFAGGLLLAISPSSKLVALRVDGAGDVTKSALAWSSEENVPDIASPVSNGELVFTVTSSGKVTCFEIKSGHKLWDHDLNLDVQASPVITADKLLVLGENGAAVVCAAAREFKEVSRSQLNDRFLASPALAQGRVFLRGETNLFCLGKEGLQ